MPECELSIEFDRESREYKTGEHITGRVVVRTGEDVTCNGLTITCGWETHGRGDKDKGPQEKLNAFTGIWSLGQTYSYPFEFEVPPGPVTYHGHLVNIDWYVRVRADVPWAFDPKCEEDFIVAVAERAGANPGGIPQYNPGQSSRVKNASPTTSLIIGLICWAITAGCGYWWYSSGNWFPIFFGGVVAIFALIATIGGINGIILKRHIGNIVVALEPQSTVPGGSTTCLVTLRPKKPTELNRITAVLKCTESATYSQGTDRVTATHELYTEEHVLSEAVQLMAGEVFDGHGDIPVPESAAYSFNSSNNSVVWVIQMDVDIKSLPDWSDKFELTVTY